MSGKGLHSGLPTTVALRRRGEDGAGGLRFSWPAFEGPPGNLAGLPRHARRGTCLKTPAGEIRTPEHLLAAALFFAEAPLDVACDAPEPPGLDGSAAPYFEAMANLAPEAASRPAWREYPSNLHWIHDGPEGSLHAAPAARFSVEYVLCRGPLDQRVFVDDPAAAAREILPARTFIFWEEWRGLAGDKSLLAGAGPDSGLMYAMSSQEFAAARAAEPALRGGKFPLLHPESERLPDEAARHKILDLLGDLALLGLALPRLRLRVVNGGHALNHLLLERLQDERRQAPS